MEKVKNNMRSTAQYHLRAFNMCAHKINMHAYMTRYKYRSIYQSYQAVLLWWGGWERDEDWKLKGNQWAQNGRWHGSIMRRYHEHRRVINSPSTAEHPSFLAPLWNCVCGYLYMSVSISYLYLIYIIYLYHLYLIYIIYTYRVCIPKSSCPST